MEKRYLKTVFALLFAVAVSRCASANWLDEVRVNTETSGKQASRGSDCPWSLACGPDGRVHVIWEDRRTGRQLRIFYRGKSPSPTWNLWDPTDVNISPIDTTDLLGHPSIGALDNGSIISVYTEEKPYGGELCGTIWPAGFNSWNQPEFVSIPGGNYLTFTSTGWQTTIATNGHRAVTFWPYVGDSLNGHRPIFYRRYDHSTWESTERPLELPGLGLLYDAKNLSAVWAITDTVYLAFAAITAAQPIYNIYFVKLHFVSAEICLFERVTDDSVISAQFPYASRFPTAHGDDIYISYTEYGHMAKAKLAVKRHDFPGWTTGVDIVGDSVSSAYPCLAFNPHGWLDLAYEVPANEPNSQIFHRRYYPESGSFGPDERVSEGRHFSKRPVVACDKYGNVHIIYISNRIHPEIFGDEEVYYRMFDSPPLKPTDVFVDGDTLRWNYPDLPDFRVFVIFHISAAETTMIGSTRNRYFRQVIGPDAVFGVRALDLNYQASPLAISQSPSDIPPESPRAADFALGLNYPNPFNRSTVIPIVNPSAQPATIEIIDICGKLLRRLEITPGQNRVLWDGKNAAGSPVVSGRYFYRGVQNDLATRPQMMILVK